MWRVREEREILCFCLQVGIEARWGLRGGGVEEEECFIEGQGRCAP
jgi:hypothetical protein